MIRKFLKSLIWLLPVLFLLPDAGRAETAAPRGGGADVPTTCSFRLLAFFENTANLLDLAPPPPVSLAQLHAISTTMEVEKKSSAGATKLTLVYHRSRADCRC